MAKPIDLKGQSFGRLMAIKMVARSKRGDVMWECVCDCGNTVVINGFYLRNGDTKSCGCINHGMSNSPEYETWGQMLGRCNNKNNEHYPNYGGRGITVCEQWYKFDNFFKDMGNRPSLNYSIDRIDNDKGYFKSNCRWGTATEQARNQRLDKRNKTGMPGVYYRSRYDKYEVSIMANRKRFYVGYFNLLEDAIKAREQAELKYWNK